MLRLIIARHGQSEGDTKDLVEGSADLPLTATGELQGRLLAERIARDYRPAAVFVSGLRRAGHIAALIGEMCQVPVFADRRLDEWSTGILAGVPFAEANQRYPWPERGHLYFELVPGAETGFDHLARVSEFLFNLLDVLGEPWPGVYGPRVERFAGEAVRDLAPWGRDLLEAVEEAQCRAGSAASTDLGRPGYARDGVSAGRTLVIIAHGGTISRLLQALVGMLPTAGPIFPHGDTGLTEVDLDRRLIVRRSNCQAHLPPVLRAPLDRDLAADDPSAVAAAVEAWQKVGAAPW